MSLPTFRGNSFDVAQVHRFSTSPSKLVIGIDLATTRCCLATGQRLLVENYNYTPPDVKLYSCWPASYEAGSKWPITALLYESQGLPMTGNDLEIAFKSPRARKFNMNKHFRQWKLLFHDDQRDPMTRKIQDQLSQKLKQLGKTRLDLLRDWVRVIYDQLLKVNSNDGFYSLNESTGRFDKKDIEIVVTVPPGRSVLAHDQVHEAFIQGPIGKGQVFLVSEPEAMFRSWIHDGADTQDFKVGKRYLVADGGGGTCCLVRFRLDKLKPSLGFEQEFESESLVCGAESISNLVEEKLGQKVPYNYPNRAWILDELRRKFDEGYKSRFGGDESNDTYPFELPGSTREIELSRQEIADCFDTCIAKLLKAMDRQLSRGLPVHFLVLGGGLFASPYVMRAVEKHFSKLKICPLSADKGHVARGAVLVRACAPFIIRRPILRSKAVTTFLEVTDEIRRSPLYPRLYVEPDVYEGKEWYHAAQWLAKQGTELEAQHADDIHEVASEANFADARKRYFDISTADLTFSETILTFNHSPPANEKLVVQLKDESWASLNGNSIPKPESSEKLTWDPKKIGVNVSTLEISPSNEGKPFRILRYSIQMQMQEVGTKYQFKTWSWTKPAKTKGRVRQILLSEAHERQALFNPQEISENLAVSYDLGSGTRTEVSRGDEEPQSETLHRQHEVLVQQQQQVTKDPSAAQNLPKQAAHVTYSSSHGPMTATLASLIAAQINQATDKRHLSVPSSFGTREVMSSHSGRFQDRQPSRSPLRTARPTQRQSIEGNAEYSVGAPRNNGGCWTCAFRNLKCELGAPKCLECTSLGIVCEYGRPVWWYDENLREKQKAINKRLIKEHKAMLASKRQAVEAQSPASLLNPVSSSSEDSSHVEFLSAPAQKARLPNPPIGGALKTVRRRVRAYIPKAKAPLNNGKAAHALDEDDIYDVTPPPPKRARLFPEQAIEAGSDGGVTGSADNWIRRSTRQREPVKPAADMIMWDEIDAEEFEVAYETTDSD